MLQENDAGHAGDQESAERSLPTVPPKTENYRRDEANENGDPLNISILPADKLVPLQVGHVVVGLIRIQFENKPADVRVEKAFRDIIRVVVVIDMLMVAAMFARPHQDRVFKSGRAKQQSKKPDRPARLECDVRKKSMITNRDTEAARHKHREEKRDLEPIESKVVEIKGNTGQRDEQCADKERTRYPVDAVERQSQQKAAAGDGRWLSCPATFRIFWVLQTVKVAILGNRRFHWGHNLHRLRQIAIGLVALLDFEKFLFSPT